MIKVSVIVPVFNMEKYLNRCLDSLVNQTLKDIEIIIIDDCSTDNSINIIREYERKYNNVKVIENHKNKGIGYNRNIGIDNSKGEYISFIDSDDWVDKTFLEKMYNKANVENLDLVISRYKKVIDETNKEIKSDYPIDYFDVTSLREKPDLLLNINFAPWNKIYKKSILKNNRFPEDLKYEDAIFVVKAIADSNKIGLVPEELNYYLIRSKSETTCIDKKVFDILKITKMMVDYLKKLNYYPDIEEFLEAYVVRNLFRYTLQQRYQVDKELKNKFIDDVFMYLNLEFPNWKKNKIWKKRNFIKKMIEKNKFLTKLYCNI